MRIIREWRQRVESQEEKLRLVAFSRLGNDLCHEWGGTTKFAAHYLVIFLGHIVSHIAMGRDPSKDFDVMWERHDSFYAANQTFVNHYVKEIKVRKLNAQAAEQLKRVRQNLSREIEELERFPRGLTVIANYEGDEVIGELIGFMLDLYLIVGGQYRDTRMLHRSRPPEQALP